MVLNNPNTCYGENKVIRNVVRIYLCICSYTHTGSYVWCFSVATDAGPIDNLQQKRNDIQDGEYTSVDEFLEICKYEINILENGQKSWDCFLELRIFLSIYPIALYFQFRDTLPIHNYLEMININWIL